MNLSFRRWLSCAVGLLLSASSSSWGQGATLEQARRLVEQRNPSGAYQLLKPLEGERAGDPDYDYLLGIAALDAGRLTEAVFALERVLAVRPGHTQARAEIGRAYYQLGEVETARRELESVRREPIPEEVSQTIQKYLDVIEQAQASTRTSVSGYLEFGGGYDSNVNSGASSSQVLLPAFPGLGLATLNAAALKQHDLFASLAAGLNVRHPIRPGLAVFGGVDGSQRLNADRTAFDLGSHGANAGVEISGSPNRFTFGVQAQNLYSDWRRFRDSVGVTGQWQRQVGGNAIFTGYLQYNALRYPGQAARDADRKLGGIAFAQGFGGRFSPVGFFGAYYGHEDERDASRPDSGHRLYGLRLGGQLSVGDQVTAFVSAAYEDRSYGGAVPGFVENRSDQQRDVALGVSYTPSKLWVVSPQLSYTNNKSNVSFVDFERTQALVTVRRVFR